MPHSSWSNVQTESPHKGLGPPTERAPEREHHGNTVRHTDHGRRSCIHGSRVEQTAFPKHQFWRMLKLVLLAALVCAVLIRPSSAQDDKVSVDMMGIGGMSCAHWQSTQALRLEGTIWIYGFWTGLNYVAVASGQMEPKVDTAAVVVEVKKTCAQRPSQVLASAVWTAYLDLNKR